MINLEEIAELIHSHKETGFSKNSVGPKYLIVGIQVLFDIMSHKKYMDYVYSNEKGHNYFLGLRMVSANSNDENFLSIGY